MSFNIKNCTLRGFVIACRWARLKWGGDLLIADMTEEQQKTLQNVAREWDKRQKIMH